MSGNQTLWLGACVGFACAAAVMVYAKVRQHYDARRARAHFVSRLKLVYDPDQNLCADLTCRCGVRVAFRVRDVAAWWELHRTMGGVER